MTDLYETLGVPRDADEKAIRKAYRSKSKKAHPDAGGSDKEFNELNHAMEVLTDPDRRARYDATGEHEQAQPDNLQAQALNFIALLFKQLMGQSPATTLDYPRVIEKHILEMLAHSGAQRAVVNQKIAQMERLRGRFSADGQDVMSAMVESEIAEARAPLAQADASDKMMATALEIVKRHKFKADQQHMGQGFANARSSGTFGGLG